MEESEETSLMEKVSEYLKEVGVQEEDMIETESDEVVRSWVNWARSRSNVKCVEADVPAGILPKNYRGVLIDVKVGGKKRVPDDKIYLENKDLREKVARGNCVLELSRIDKGRISSTKYLFLVFALRKFSGGMGDEDDSNCGVNEWEKYFIKPISDAKTLISTEKANGEAAHVASVQICGNTYLCFGSKNVHLIVRNKADIEKYKESRFEFARRVANAFFSTYIDNCDISLEKKREFVSFLQETRYTAVAEMIQPKNQHVVNLSYLKEPELKFICWTKADLDGNFSGKDSYCSVPIHRGRP